MSVPQAGSQVLFFELSGRGKPLNLIDASNPDDPDDPNVYNLQAIMVGRSYQIIRIYTSPNDFLNAEFGSMGGAAILWAALFFFANFARGLAGRRSRCPRGRRQEPGNRAGRAQARRPAAGFLRSPCAAVPASCQLTIFQLSVAKTAGFVIVDEACRLHKGVADGAADKTEAAFFQFAAQRV